MATDTEIDAAELALSQIHGMRPRDAAEHIVAMLRPSMWLRLQRELDSESARADHLEQLLHPSTQGAIP